MPFDIDSHDFSKNENGFDQSCERPSPLLYEIRHPHPSLKQKSPNDLLKRPVFSPETFDRFKFKAIGEVEKIGRKSEVTKFLVDRKKCNLFGGMESIDMKDMS